jgi:thymidylate synthase ThyX
MSFKSEIIADSINSKNKRLTTYILEYPRFVHAELMTHRMFSKNAASSRAIPIEKMIQQVIDNPAMPVWWGKNQSGMQAKEELGEEKYIEYWSSLIEETKYCKEAEAKYLPESYLLISAIDLAKRKWIEARDEAIKHVRFLNSIGLHKQIANRILEPWFNIRIILSGTEFENFFALRAHPDAQPEIQALAYLMLEQYNKSEPKKLKAGEWHIPFGDKIDKERLWNLVNSWESDRNDEPASCYWGTNQDGFEEAKIKIAIARCARISYHNYEGKDDYQADITLCDRLFGSVPRHLSPTEHVAQAQDDDKFIGNFAGFKQFRYMFDDQNLTDGRVVRK